MIMAHVSLADCFTLLLLAAGLVLTEMFLDGEFSRPEKAKTDDLRRDKAG